MKQGIYAQLKRWWNCQDRIDTLLNSKQNTIDHLLNVTAYIGKKDPDIVLLLDKSVSDMEYNTMAAVLMIKGEDITISNVDVNFQDLTYSPILFIADINGAVIKDSNFNALRKPDEIQH